MKNKRSIQSLEAEIKNLKKYIKNLKRGRDYLYELCYREAGLTPDCNPYYCVMRLKKDAEEAQKAFEEMNALAGEYHSEIERLQAEHEKLKKAGVYDL